MEAKPNIGTDGVPYCTAPACPLAVWNQRDFTYECGATECAVNPKRDQDLCLPTVRAMVATLRALALALTGDGNASETDCLARIGELTAERDTDQVIHDLTEAREVIRATDGRIDALLVQVAALTAERDSFRSLSLEEMRLHSRTVAERDRLRERDTAFRIKAVRDLAVVAGERDRLREQIHVLTDSQTLIDITKRCVSAERERERLRERVAGLGLEVCEPNQTHPCAGMVETVDWWCENCSACDCELDLRRKTNAHDAGGEG